MRFSGLSTPSEARWADATFAARVAPMAVRGWLHKPLFGTSAGPLFIGRRTRISNQRYLHHDGRLVIEDDVELQGLSVEGIRFGAGVSLGRGVTIRPSSYYGGDVGIGLTVGDRSSFATGCFIGCSGRIEIGRDVMLGPGVRLFSENHIFSSNEVPIKDQGVQRGTLTIGDDCWIASGVTVTANVRIGSGVVIGAGSVVTRDVPDFSIAVGSPARVVGTRLEA
ncbi:acyltransferase [Microbacterium lacticum]